MTELVNAMKIHSIRKTANKQAEEIERQRHLEEESVAEEISSEIDDEPAETENTPAITENTSAETNNAPTENRESEEDYPDFIG